MEISHLVGADMITIGWPGGNPPEKPDKWALLKDLSAFLLSSKKIDQEGQKESYELVVEREKSMTTGIGHGVAIPHATVPAIKKAACALCILPEGIEFEAIDHQKVGIIFLILLPHKKFQDHIQVLANIAALTNQEEFREKLLAAQTSKEAWTILDSSE